jgi:hypothetical protein
MVIRLEYSRSIEITPDQIKDALKEFNDDLNPGVPEVISSEFKENLDLDKYQEYVEEGGNDPEDVLAFLEWVLGQL